MTPPLIIPQDAGQLEWLLLPDFSSKDSCVIGFDGKLLFRLNTWTFDQNLKEYSCFYGTQIIKDGNIIFCTKLDPLFIIIGLLERRELMFFGLQDLLSNDEFPDLIKLESIYNLDILLRICDHNDEIHDDIFIKLNHDKVMSWLKQKVEKVMGNNCTIDYATRLLSDYISLKLLKDLREGLGVKDLKETNENYYTDQIVIKKRNVQEKDNVVKKKSKTLKKNDTKGMKSIKSFFTKK